MNRSKQAMLAHEDLRISTLALIIIDEYGVEALNWDPETIILELQDDAHVELSDLNAARVGCLVSLLTTDSFYYSLPDFINICNVVSGDVDNPSLWKPASLHAIIYALSEIQLLDPQDTPLQELLDPEIVSYIELQLRDAGATQPPDCLRFVKPEHLAVADIATIQEDPVLFSASYQIATEASEELQQFENSALVQLVQELMMLELENGDVKSLFERKSYEDQETGRTAPYGQIADVSE